MLKHIWIKQTNAAANANAAHVAAMQKTKTKKNANTLTVIIHAWYVAWRECWPELMIMLTLWQMACDRTFMNACDQTMINQSDKSNLDNYVQQQQQ